MTHLAHDARNAHSQVREDFVDRPLNVLLLDCMHVCSVMANSLQPHGLEPAKFLCPWDYPGKSTRVGCHFLLQSIFLIQGLNPRLLYWQVDSLPLSYLGSFIAGLGPVKSNQKSLEHLIY